MFAADSLINLANLYVFCQNPPWQIIRYNGDGEIVSTSGIAMHILDELALKLNFTYHIVDPFRMRATNASFISQDSIAQNVSRFEIKKGQQVFGMTHF